MLVSSGDYLGGYTVSGGDADISAPGTEPELLTQETISVDTTSVENLLTGIDNKLSWVILFCTLFVLYIAGRMVYRFFNGLFG